MNADSARLASAGFFPAVVTTVGDEPLICDAQIPVQQGQVGALLAISFIATLTTRQPDTRGLPPNSGLYLCPPSTPTETLAQAQGGFNADARPIAIPLADPYLDVATVGAVPTYTLVMASKPGLVLPIPAGWFIRAIVVCQQGSATPGPGALSVGRLNVCAAIESACPC